MDIFKISRLAQKAGLASEENQTGLIQKGEKFLCIFKCVDACAKACANGCVTECANGCVYVCSVHCSDACSGHGCAKCTYPDSMEIRKFN